MLSAAGLPSLAARLNHSAPVFNISSYGPVLLRAHFACAGSFSHVRVRERKRHEFLSRGVRAHMNLPTWQMPAQLRGKLARGWQLRFSLSAPWSPGADNAQQIMGFQQQPASCLPRVSLNTVFKVRS